VMVRVEDVDAHHARAKLSPCGRTSIASTRQSKRRLRPPPHSPGIGTRPRTTGSRSRV
jgi:hypothetical protein